MLRFLMWLALRSRPFRTIAWRLPRGRIRTYLVGSFFHELIEQWGRGEFDFLRAVSNNGAFKFFTLGTVVGPQGFKDALIEWRDLFRSPSFEVVKFATFGPSVFLVIRWGAEGARSGIALDDDFFYAVVHVEGGMAVGGELFREKTEALEAARVSI